MNKPKVKLDFSRDKSFVRPEPANKINSDANSDAKIGRDAANRDDQKTAELIRELAKMDPYYADPSLWDVETEFDLAIAKAAAAGKLGELDELEKQAIREIRAGKPKPWPKY